MINGDDRFSSSKGGNAGPEDDDWRKGVDLPLATVRAALAGVGMYPAVGLREEAGADATEVILPVFDPGNPF